MILSMVHHDSYNTPAVPACVSICVCIAVYIVTDRNECPATSHTLPYPPPPPHTQSEASLSRPVHRGDHLDGEVEKKAPSSATPAPTGTFVYVACSGRCEQVTCGLFLCPNRVHREYHSSYL